MKPSASSAAPRTSRTLSTLSNASSPTNASPSSPSLPTEILAYILELTTTGLEPLERQATRIAFSKVSRAWYLGSRDAFSEVVVEASKRAKELSKVLATDKKATSTTKRRVVTALVLLDEGSTAGGAGRGERFASLIKALPGLKSFEYHAKSHLGTGSDMLGAELRKVLPRLSLLERFKLDIGQRSGEIYAGQLARILSSWTNLVELDAARLYVTDENNVGADDYTINTHVRKIKALPPLVNMFTRASTPAITDMILTGSFNHVSFFNRSKALERDGLKAVVAAVTSSLVSLHLPCYTRYSAQGPRAGDFLHATLEQLVPVETLVIPLSIVAPATILISLVKLPSLRSLKFTDTLVRHDSVADSSLVLVYDDVVDFIRDAPVLEHFSLTSDTKWRWGKGDYKAVRKVAREVEVSFVVEASMNES